MIRNKGMIRARDLAKYGFSRSSLQNLLKKEEVIKIARGIYSLPEMEANENVSIAEVVTHVPDSVICLLSALSYHGITTQIPHSVWIALPHKAWRPTIEGVSYKVVFMQEKYLTAGVETVEFSHVKGKIFSVAKTVVDCFKYRNKIGLDVALEALRDALSQKKTTISEIMEYAKICRVKSIITPYMEAMV